MSVDNSKPARLARFYERLHAAPAASNQDEARSLLVATLNSVEEGAGLPDRLASGAPHDPSDPRMYPPWDDNRHTVPSSPALVRSAARVTTPSSGRTAQFASYAKMGPSNSTSPERTEAMSPSEVVANLRQSLQAAFPDAEVSIDTPDDPALGSTWVDLVLGAGRFVVEWNPRHGLAVSNTEGDGYGDAPDKRCASPADVVEWLRNQAEPRVGAAEAVASSVAESASSEPHRGLIELDAELPAGASMPKTFVWELLRGGAGPKWQVRGTVITRTVGNSRKIKAVSITLLDGRAKPLELGEKLRVFSDSGDLGSAHVIAASGAGLRRDRSVDATVI